MKRHLKILATVVFVGLFLAATFNGSAKELEKSCMYVVEISMDAEVSLEIEEWMFSDLSFEYVSYIYEPADKKDMKIEEWMSDNSNWQSKEDGELQIENWMINDDYWKTN